MAEMIEQPDPPFPDKHSRQDTSPLGLAGPRARLPSTMVGVIAEMPSTCRRAECRYVFRAMVAAMSGMPDRVTAVS